MYLYPLMPLIIEEITLRHAAPILPLYVLPSLGRSAQNVIQRPRVGLSVGHTSRLLHDSGRPAAGGPPEGQIQKRSGSHQDLDEVHAD